MGGLQIPDRDDRFDADGGTDPSPAGCDDPDDQADPADPDPPAAG